MNDLYNGDIRRNIMGILLLLIMVLGTYAALVATLGGETNNVWTQMVPFAGYIALGSIILYIPLSILDTKLYEKTVREEKEKKDS